MMVQLAPGWQTKLEHGPDWLFVRLFGPHGDEADATGIAETLHMLLQQDLTHRMVLELDELQEVTDEFVQELIQLQELFEQANQVLRLCGACEEHEEAFRAGGLSNPPLFRTRREAVLGFYRPGKPR
jgi:hypothetical protein